MKNSSDNKLQGLTLKGKIELKEQPKKRSNPTSTVKPKAAKKKIKHENPKSNRERAAFSLKKLSDKKLNKSGKYSILFSKGEIAWALKMKIRFLDFPRLPKRFLDTGDMSDVHTTIQSSCRSRIQNWLYDAVRNNHPEKLAWVKTFELAPNYGYILE